MRASAGRRTALAAAAIALPVAALAAFLGAKPALEWWWLRELRRADDDAARVRAAGKLADLKSLRAVPDLIRLIEEDEREEGFGSSSEIVLTPLAHALWSIGPDETVRRTLAAEKLSYGRLHEVLAAIVQAWDEKVEVTRVEYGES